MPLKNDPEDFLRKIPRMKEYHSTKLDALFSFWNSLADPFPFLPLYWRNATEEEIKRIAKDRGSE